MAFLWEWTMAGIGGKVPSLRRGGSALWNEHALFWATSPDELMVLAVTYEMKQQLIKISFLGRVHGLQDQPDQRWHIIQEPFCRDKA
jgi:hypothetical protein